MVLRPWEHALANVLRNTTEEFLYRNLEPWKTEPRALTTVHNTNNNQYTDSVRVDLIVQARHIETVQQRETTQSCGLLTWATHSRVLLRKARTLKRDFFVIIVFVWLLTAVCVFSLCRVWQCSVTCDEGIQQRQVVCKASDNTIGECEGEKPETVLICKLGPCPGEIHVQPIFSILLVNIAAFCTLSHNPLTRKRLLTRGQITCRGSINLSWNSTYYHIKVFSQHHGSFFFQTLCLNVLLYP